MFLLYYQLWFILFHLAMMLLISYPVEITSKYSQYWFMFLFDYWCGWNYIDESIIVESWIKDLANVIGETLNDDEVHEILFPRNLENSCRTFSYHTLWSYYVLVQFMLDVLSNKVIKFTQPWWRKTTTFCNGIM